MLKRPLAAGDEIRRQHCGRWHPTVQPYPDDPHPYGQRMLFFDCPRKGGPFFAGCIGTPAHRAESRPATPDLR
jgi:hypothetical protein